MFETLLQNMRRLKLRFVPDGGEFGKVFLDIISGGLVPLLLALAVELLHGDLKLQLAAGIVILVGGFSLVRFGNRKLSREISKTGARKFIEAVYEHVSQHRGPGPLAEVLRVLRQEPNCILSHFEADDRCDIALPSTASIATAVLEHELNEVKNGKVQLSALHVIPRNRPESFWWGGDAEWGKYFELQVKELKQGKLIVKRLLSPPSGHLARSGDLLIWALQAQSGVNLRLAGAESPLRNSSEDFCVVESFDNEGKRIRSVAIYVQQQSDERGRHVTLDFNGERNASKLIEFDAEWNRQGLFEIPGDASKLNEAKLNTLVESASTEGVVAFLQALDHIGSAKRMVEAVEISDVKRSLKLVKEDPSYTEWYKKTIEAASRPNINFRRVFVIRRTQESVSELIENHLPDYFDDNTGRRFQNCTVYVVWLDVLEIEIQQIDIKNLQAFLNELPLVRKRLERLGQFKEASDTDLRATLRGLLLRDFLFTEEILYDFRQEEPTFEVNELLNYLTDIDNVEADEWQRVVTKLVDVGAGITATRLEEFKRQLLAAL